MITLEKYAKHDDKLRAFGAKLEENVAALFNGALERIPIDPKKGIGIGPDRSAESFVFKKEMKDESPSPDSGADRP